MKPEQLEKFRERLLAERDSVVVKVKAHSGPITSAIDEVEEAIVESDENLLEKIDLALKQIAEGTYGICRGCQSTISIARLDAKPAVSLCTQCQENKESSART